MQGLVIRNTGSWYDVRTDDGQLFACKVKGNFRLRGIRSTNPVAVGDRVEIQPTMNDAFIIDILPRRNYIIRRASNLSRQSHIIAANVDLAALVVTIAHPQTSTTFIDRFLATAEAYSVPAALLFNKTDLYDDTQRNRMEELISLYRHLDYVCLPLSAVTGENLDALQDLLRGKVTLLSGNSGVGKSTLLNLLVPYAQAKTAALSAAHDQGQHTTTFSQMYSLPSVGEMQDAYIIDTPGIRGFGTIDFHREEVSHYFPEIFRQGTQCRYHNCTHTHEPDCAVIRALHNSDIAESRYRSYLSMLEDEHETKYRQKL